MTTAKLTPARSFQRSIERWYVRNLARLEAGIGDRWIPNVASVTLAGALVYLGIARIDGLRSGSDLASYTQAVWMIGEGQNPEATLFGSRVHLLELHWSFILYPIAFVAKSFSVAKTLITIQALALGAGVIPLWRLARRVAKLRIGAASALILAYSVHPTTHILGLEDFHPVSLAVPAFIGMAYFGETQRWRCFWFCIAFVLACRADLGIAVAIWGLIVTSRSDRRVGLWAVGVGLVWAFGFLLVAQPIMGQPGSKGGYAGQSFGEVILVTLREPTEVFLNLVSAENTALLIAILAPTIFLPLLSVRHLSAGVLVAMFSLVADLPAQISLAERSALLFVFSVIASTFALRRLGTAGVDRVFIDARLLTALVAAALLIYLNSSPVSPYREPWAWGDESEQQIAVEAAVASVDATASVRASPSVLTGLAARERIFELDTSEELSATSTAFPDDVNVVLVLDSDVPAQMPDQIESFNEGMKSLGFRLRSDNGVRLYVR